MSGIFSTKKIVIALKLLWCIILIEPSKLQQMWHFLKINEFCRKKIPINFSTVGHADRQLQKGKKGFKKDVQKY